LIRLRKEVLVQTLYLSRAKAVLNEVLTQSVCQTLLATFTQCSTVLK